MKKINYIQSSAVIMLISVMGCATGSNPANPLGTIDQGLSTIEGAAQSSRQVINAGTAAANTATVNQVGLVDILMSQLGVSREQALGGAGAIFQAAQGNMTPQAFATLSQSVPGMNSMLNAAPVSSNLAGGLSTLMGGTNNTVGSMTALAASFQQLNLSPDMVGQFIPVVTNYVSQTSGQVSANLLQSALAPR
jgi:hypothetical protein